MAPETRAMEIKQLEETLRSLIIESREHFDGIIQTQQEMLRNLADRQNASHNNLMEAIQTLDNKHQEDLSEIRGKLADERPPLRSLHQAGILGTPSIAPAANSGMRNSSLQMVTVTQPTMDTIFTRLPKIEFPKFSGDNVMGWVFRCEQFFEISQTPQEWKVKLASIYLDGIALEWHQNFSRSNPTPIGWGVYKEAIKERFGETAYDDPMYELSILKQTGTIQDYNNQFDALLTRVVLPENYVVSCYLGGLKEELLGMVRLMKPKSLREAFSVAKLQESNLIQQQKKNKGWYKPGTTHGAGFIASETVASKTAAGSNGSQSKETSRRVISNSTFDERRAKGLCFWCNEKYTQGHNCRRKQLYLISMTEDTGVNPEAGEYQVEEMIEEEVELESEPKVSLNAITGIPSFQTMTVMGTIKKKRIYILIDSGSTHNFLDPSIVELDDYEVETIPEQQVVVANGGKISLCQQIKKFQWQMQGSTFTANALLMPLESYNMILGVQWLSELGMVNWDFKNLTMKFTLNRNPIILRGTRIPFLQVVSEKQLDKAILNSTTAIYLCFCYSQVHSINPSFSSYNPMNALNTQQQGELDMLLEFYVDIFMEPRGLPPHRAQDHQIILKEGTDPINVKPYRYPALQKAAIERLIMEMKDAGIIRDSASPFSSPIVLIKKKDGSWRLCVDYRELNSKTIRDRFPIPVIEELLDELHGSTYFSKLDLRSGYWQVRMMEEDIRKTAFRTHEGHYEFLVMPFGLTNAPVTFQKLMNSIFKPYLRIFVLVFFDDILVYSRTWDEHLHHLKTVLDVLATHSLKVKRNKCDFAVQSIEYLGHCISSRGVSTDPNKIRAIVEWPKPSSVRELRGFLGLAGYYRRFIKDYGKISRGLTELLKKDAFKWDSQAEVSFSQLKQQLSQPPVLALPDFTQPFVVETDACGAGIGAVLMQSGRPIAYFSKGLSTKHQQLPVYDKEMLAIVAAIQKWRPYLLGNHFKVKTDHQSLRFLLEQRITTPTQQKWLSKLAGYDFEIIYRKGQENIAADALSRRTQTASITLNAVLEGMPTELLNGVRNSWNLDAKLLDIIRQLQNKITVNKPYTWQNNLLRWKGKLVIGSDFALRQQLIQMIHMGSMGGHSGFIPTLHKLKSMFHWKGMGKATKIFIQECNVCQQNKYETSSKSGPLQPLPIPEKVWTNVSMDFIEGLPKSNGKDTIFVVVDRLSKYAHFMALAHPFSATTVAQAYLDNVYKLHGMPEKIVSDRDKIFLSRFWQELLKLLKVQVQMSTAYHPQTDGQTEVVNRCLETYLRCMTVERPKEWLKWLPLSEWWYNTNYHSSLKCSPYEVLYGQKPPLHVPYLAGTAVVDAVDRSLQSRENFIKLLKHHLLQAMNRMKVQADKHRKEREFEVGDLVYVKLQPYRQDSVSHRMSRKLAPKYFGPFEILAKVGTVAYKLKLPDDAKIHPVFHVSILKKSISNRPIEEVFPSELTTFGQLKAEPVAILKRRTILRKRHFLEQVLIQWSNTSPEDASWEDLETICSQYPHFMSILEDKDCLREG
ncbi:putative mitochondrial protein [Apostasia shenzhenica]|uniref:RNA-directed DNA polymerase n=1 Tax=Apostasia shenzhenica TaxID=1088818 RepID=A0A2H9ZUK5_9ASPA|nr:putative mitochondrial protein [Apostasia shenzhenica]